MQASLKITFEAPPGVKKNLQRTYDAWSADHVKAGSGLRAQLLFALAWFHAVVQERRNYIPQVRAPTIMPHSICLTHTFPCA